jgi:hypothetical protein
MIFEIGKDLLDPVQPWFAWRHVASRMEDYVASLADGVAL